MIMVLNLVFLLMAAVIFALPYLFPFLGLIIIAPLAYLIFVYICAATEALGEVSDYRSLTVASFTSKIKGAFRPALVLFAASLFILYLAWVAVPVYMNMASILGVVAAFFTGWLCVFILAAIQFYPAVYYRLGKRPVKSLKKCVIIFLDNTAFCIGSLIVNVILTVLLIPAPCMPLSYLDQGLRLRLLKYDWLDARAADQNSASYEQGWRKAKIPWNDLLKEEKDNTGDRTFRSFIFPWKE
jgi:hypothetical protein